MSQRDPEAKRVAVLSAAAAAFAEQGFAATSTSELASTAQVSEGIVFHYFGSKHGLLEACATAEATGFADIEIAQHLSGLDYPRLTEATFRWVGDNRMVRRLWAEGDDRTVGALRRGWQAGLVPAVASALVPEQAAGRCRAGQPERLARMQFAVMGEALVVHFDAPDSWPRADAVAETAVLLEALVRP